MFCPRPERVRRCRLIASCRTGATPARSAQAATPVAHTGFVKAFCGIWGQIFSDCRAKACRFRGKPVNRPAKAVPYSAAMALPANRSVSGTAPVFRATGRTALNPGGGSPGAAFARADMHTVVLRAIGFAEGRPWRRNAFARQVLLDHGCSLSLEPVVQGTAGNGPVPGLFSQCPIFRSRRLGDNEKSGMKTPQFPDQ